MPPCTQEIRFTFQTQLDLLVHFRVGAVVLHLVGQAVFEEGVYIVQHVVRITPVSDRVVKRRHPTHI